MPSDDASSTNRASANVQSTVRDYGDEYWRGSDADIVSVSASKVGSRTRVSCAADAVTCHALCCWSVGLTVSQQLGSTAEDGTCDCSASTQHPCAGSTAALQPLEASCPHGIDLDELD